MPIDIAANKLLAWVEDTETVTITRRTPAATAGQFTVATVYTGPADVQSEFGTIFYNASGAQDTADATCLIDPDTNGTLPAVQVNDIVAVTGGETYTVVHEANWNMAPKHLELTLKRGKLTRKA